MASPAFTPLRTRQCCPTASATSIGRCSTLLSGVTTSTLALPLNSRLTACCGTSRALGTKPVVRRARTYMPGSSTRSGFGTWARKVMAPVEVLTFTPSNFKVAACG